MNKQKRDTLLNKLRLTGANRYLIDKIIRRKEELNQNLISKLLTQTDIEILKTIALEFDVLDISFIFNIKEVEARNFKIAFLNNMDFQYYGITEIDAKNIKRFIHIDNEYINSHIKYLLNNNTELSMKIGDLLVVKEKVRLSMYKNNKLVADDIVDLRVNASKNIVHYCIWYEDINRTMDFDLK